MKRFDRDRELVFEEEASNTDEKKVPSNGDQETSKIIDKKIEGETRENIRKNLGDLGIYIVTHAKERNPIILGDVVARKLRLCSIDIESLLTMIYAAKRFGVDDDLKKEAEDVISQTPWFNELKKIMDGIDMKRDDDR